MPEAGVEALVVGDGPENNSNRHTIAGLAATHKWPAIYPYKDETMEGGLMSYGTDLDDVFRRAAGYVARILAGTPPGELPIYRPTKFELFINTRTAAAIGLKFPDTLLARADKVIE